MCKVTILLGAVPCQTNEQFKEDHLKTTARSVASDPGVERYVSNIVVSAPTYPPTSWAQREMRDTGLLAVDEVWMADGARPEDDVLHWYSESNVIGAYVCADDADCLDAAREADGCLEMRLVKAGEDGSLDWGSIRSSVEGLRLDGIEAWDACCFKEPIERPFESWDGFVSFAGSSEDALRAGWSELDRDWSCTASPALHVARYAVKEADRAAANEACRF